ncbi:hypothetical protein EVAR_27336_1 [Eumeta japonica]|uniref:Uncharacterized protein n=1 Tax=Eumeta variegata TaxID=151549 RepID=A0A4C1UDR3_EUMVA|nr:hypothetical protein EVAR_27336_1 [Eumeta japonica]
MDIRDPRGVTSTLSAVRRNRVCGQKFKSGTRIECETRIGIYLNQDHVRNEKWDHELVIKIESEKNWLRERNRYQIIERDSDRDHWSRGQSVDIQN